MASKRFGCGVARNRLGCGAASRILGCGAASRYWSVVQLVDIAVWCG